MKEEAVILVVGACGLDRLLVVPTYPDADVSTIQQQTIRIITLQCVVVVVGVGCCWWWWWCWTRQLATGFFH